MIKHYPHQKLGHADHGCLHLALIQHSQKIIEAQIQRKK